MKQTMVYPIYNDLSKSGIHHVIQNKNEASKRIQQISRQRLMSKQLSSEVDIDGSPHKVNSQGLKICLCYTFLFLISIVLFGGWGLLSFFITKQRLFAIFGYQLLIAGGGGFAIMILSALLL